MAAAFLLCLATARAQNTFPGTGYVGIGTTSPLFWMQMVGGHGDTRFGLHFDNPAAPLNQADLVLWASEPGFTYSGTGIGNNMYNNSTGNGGIIRVNVQRGGSYMRLLDGEIRMNVVRGDGADISGLVINSLGEVSLGGTFVNGTKLSVNGSIRAKEIKVENANWPDYVFEKGYVLPSLDSVAGYIEDHGHLPGIPSAQEVKTSGVDLGEMNARLLKKLEELTLHLISQNKLLQKVVADNKV